MTMHTFLRSTVGGVSDIIPTIMHAREAKWGEYRTKRVILEIYDVMAEAHPHRSPLPPPPRATLRGSEVLPSTAEGRSMIRSEALDMDGDQPDLFENEIARSLLDQLFEDSRLYTKSSDYKELLDFVVRLRNFAPFNAMLLQVQKPGLRYAASARDWRERFGRTPKEGARPLLILWPFGPVALVYDVQDTQGKDLPQDVASFFAAGSIDEKELASFVPLMGRKGIEWYLVDAGDQKAGSIRVVRRATEETRVTHYRMHINRNHSVPVQFATLAHELGHLFLGHLGPDRHLNVPERPPMDQLQWELEAESVSYLVCARNGVTSKSQTYLADYVNANTKMEDLALYQVMRAASQIETLLGLTAHTKFDVHKRNAA